MREYLKQTAMEGFDAELSTVRAHLAWYKHPYVDHFWTDSDGVGLVVDLRGKQMDLLDSAFSIVHRRISQDRDPAVHQAIRDTLDDFYTATNQLFEAGLIKFVNNQKSVDGLFRGKLKDARLDLFYKPKPTSGKVCQSKRQMEEAQELRQAKRLK